MRVVQAGHGDIRPLVVCYFVGIFLDAKLCYEVSPATTILNLTTPPGQGTYNKISATNPALPTLLLHWADKLGCDGFGPVVWMGFSAGCQGLRTQLLDGHTPHGIIAIDGIHSSSPPADWQIDTWRKWFYTCGAVLGPDGLDKTEDEPGAPHCRVTFSQIVPPTFQSVRATLEQITAWGPLPPQEAAPLGSADWPGVPRLYKSGNVQLWSWPGVGIAAHEYQAQAVLPTELHFMAQKLDFGALGQKPIDTDQPIVLKTEPPTAPSATIRAAAAGVPFAACGAVLLRSILQ